MGKFFRVLWLYVARFACSSFSSTFIPNTPGRNLHFTCLDHTRTDTCFDFAYHPCRRCIRGFKGDRIERDNCVQDGKGTIIATTAATTTAAAAFPAAAATFTIASSTTESATGFASTKTTPITTTITYALDSSDSTCGARSQFYCPTLHTCVRDCASCWSFTASPLKDTIVTSPNTCLRSSRRALQSKSKGLSVRG